MIPLLCFYLSLNIQANPSQCNKRALISNKHLTRFSFRLSGTFCTPPVHIINRLLSYNVSANDTTSSFSSNREIKDTTQAGGNCHPEQTKHWFPVIVPVHGPPFAVGGIGVGWKKGRVSMRLHYWTAVIGLVVYKLSHSSPVSRSYNLSSQGRDTASEIWVKSETQVTHYWLN